MAEYPYWNEDELIASDDHPTLLAIGDSWCWYPINNLLNPINNLLNLLSTDYHAILVRGANGADTTDLVKPVIMQIINQDLSLVGGYGETLKAVLISAGGNDIAGEKKINKLLRSDCSDAESVIDCFNQSGIEAVFTEIEQYYQILVDTILGKLPQTTIFIHSYDHPIPDGKSLQQPMVKRKVPKQLQQPVVTELFDLLAGVMSKLASANGAIEFVDCRNTLLPSDWLNELHPTPLGFDKLAGPWEIALRKRGFLSPR
ncbi:hypothetical protein BOW53_15225 [Solemya pervernicosa gill symbiont]|uniref:Uncharacterized protein n=1 Tax=Solemya pervernicosa gill symbiont TaxID=642797 RepID=A0A1T2L0E4_9GAMM|nr:GDSL-type esterase/lipase family protein [Solemya pervernicosa gill symbiont]OOZ38534.1 hypothetical protein BOW53_15225 [Solemya pervernicosa gill symbiont]